MTRRASQSIMIRMPSQSYMIRIVSQSIMTGILHPAESFLLKACAIISTDNWLRSK